jgi:hypothetical protein
MRRLADVLLNGFILTFFSEWMFWSGKPPDADLLFGVIPQWLLYSLAAFLMLTAADYFRARNVWAVFLVGALYGWLVEGVIVQTMYDNFPLHLSWTGLAWHALISVIFGWWVLPRLLRAGRGVLACLGFGLALGVWSIGWWWEPTGFTPVEVLWLYNFGFGAPLLLAYMLRDRLHSERFTPNRWIIYAVIGLFVLYFAFITVPTQPLALGVFPPLLLIVLATLWRNRRHETADAPATAAVPLTLRDALPLLLIPLTASVVYTLAAVVGFAPQSNIAVFVLTTPIGFLLFVASILRVWFRRKTNAA